MGQKNNLVKNASFLKSDNPKRAPILILFIPAIAPLSEGAWLPPGS